MHIIIDDYSDPDGDYKIAYNTFLFKNYPNLEFTNNWKNNIYKLLNRKTLKERELERKNKFKISKMEKHFI